MSERYGKCAPCAGPECFICTGTGFSGSAIDYIERQNRLEMEREWKGYGWYRFKESSGAYLKAENAFYGHVRRTRAMRAAIDAVDQYFKRQAERKNEMHFKEDEELGLVDNFVKLKNSGDSITGVFRGDVYEFKQHWRGNGKKSEPCKGDGCDLCASGNIPKVRFRINMIVREDGRPVAKIFEQGARVYKQLRDLNKEWPLDKNTVKITRTGTDQSTTYAILPMSNGGLTAEAEKALSGIQLHDLKQEAVQASMPENEEIPF